MAADEHQSQHVVVDAVLEGRVEVRHERLLLDLELVTELGLLTFEPLGATEVIDGPPLRNGHEPGARVVRNA